MRLNPKKCTFGVRSVKFLGYMVSKDKIWANSNKLSAFMEMSLPKTIKEVQRLIRQIIVLNKFLSRSAIQG